LKTGKANFPHGDEGIIEINQNFNFYINESTKEEKKDNDKTVKTDRRKIYEQKIVMKIVLVNEMDMTEEIFKQYKDKNLPLIAQPFLREVINNSMYRAGVPPFNIPLIDGKY